MRARIQLVSLAALAFVLGRLTAQPDPAEVLKEADRAFDLASAKGGAAAWASFFAEDGRMFTPRGIVTGRKAIEDWAARTRPNERAWAVDFCGPQSRSPATATGRTVALTKDGCYVWTRRSKTT